MSDPLCRDFERLVEITVAGKKFRVPEKNTCLRAFQFISPETIPYGRFCWNQECQLCRVACRIGTQAESAPPGPPPPPYEVETPVGINAIRRDD
jgi:hypothetical protein